MWQCSCIAENFGLTTALSTSHSDWAHREVRPTKRRKNSALKKSVKSHVPCPMPLVPHWLKPVAWGEKSENRTQHHALRTVSMHAYTPARLHPCTQDRSWWRKLERRL